MLYLVKRLLNMLLAASWFSPLAIVWVARAYLIDYAAGRWAFYRLPAAASAIGLKHKKSSYIREFGELYGTIRGHRVHIEPFASMNPRIRVSCGKRHEGLELSLRRPDLRPERGVVDFTTPDRRFNLSFRTRRIHGDHADGIAGNRELTGLITAFYEKWMFRLEALIIGDDDIFCSLRYGSNIFPYIPASRLGELVEDLVDMASAVDAAF